MIYLDLLNSILRRMREDEVGAITQTTYSKMVGDFINDAYGLVMNTWNWSSLRQKVTINTVDGVSEYALPQGNYNISELYAFQDGETLTYKPTRWIDKQLYNPASGVPNAYTYYDSDEGVHNIKVYPVPDGVYSLDFTMVVRDHQLTNIADKLLVPSQPVIHLTIALLARERGETGGTSTQEYFGIADRILGDAIAFDANLSPEELTWRSV